MTTYFSICSSRNMDLVSYFQIDIDDFLMTMDKKGPRKSTIVIWNRILSIKIEVPRLDQATQHSIALPHKT